MNMLKRVILAILIIFSCIFNIVDVAAKEVPDTIKMAKKSKMYYYSDSSDYIAGYNFYRKELADGTLGYCVGNINTKVPGNMTLTKVGPVDDAGLNYIILNGYPNKSFTGNAKKDYYITQSAIWHYFDETRGSHNWNTSFTSSSTGLKKYVYTLVQEAKVASKIENKEPSMNVLIDSTEMQLNSDKTLYISNLISVTSENTKDTYDVKIVSAPKGTYIKGENTSDKNISTFNKDEKFRVYVPTVDLTEKTGEVTLEIKMKGITYRLYTYTPSSSRYQDIVPVEEYYEETIDINKELKLTYHEEVVTKVKISKQDITTKEELAGATLVIKDSKGNKVDEWVSTTTPHYIENLEPGDYTLTETIAPEGYILSTETIKFTVLDDGSVTSVVMYNAKEPEVTKVKISKQDITTKEELAGATLVIKDSKGNKVDEWVSTTTPHYIENLAPGDYTLTETIAPEGYILSTETIKFTVLDDGSVTSVVMYNAKETEVTKVKISKQDITTKEELAGATLVIKDSKGNKVDEWVSTTTPHYIENLEPGDYTLTETIAPEGYILSTETIKFTVLDDGSVTSVVMYNTKPTEVPITDLDVSKTSMVIASALFILGIGTVVYYVKYSK